MLQKLNNIRSLRAMSREFSIDVLEEMLEKLRVVTEEKRSEQQSALQQQAEYQEKINTWLELMIADGITPDELVTQNAGPSKEAKNASRVRQNTGLPIFPVRKNLDRPGTYAEADRSGD
jgi:DNA-binding protein StpA